LPRYQFTMREKIKSVRGATATSGTLERAADVLQDLGKELNKPKDTATSPSTPLQSAESRQEAKPVPVEVRQPPPTALENLAALIAPLIRPLTTTGITAIFVIFILLQREDLRNRFIKLAGSHDLQKTTAALDDAATRLSRLFLIQVALNAAFGIVIATSRHHACAVAGKTRASRTGRECGRNRNLQHFSARDVGHRNGVSILS
jgi:hypothetical protein